MAAALRNRCKGKHLSCALTAAADEPGFEGPRGEPAAPWLPVRLYRLAESPGDGPASRRRR